MCYEKEQLLARILKNAIQSGADPEEIEKLRKELWELTGNPFYDPKLPKNDTPVEHWPDIIDHYHVSGFSHPVLLVYTSLKPRTFKAIEWGYIPHYVKKLSEAYPFGTSSKNLLNITSERLFEDPRNIFRRDLKFHRCIMEVEAYYEHHHYKGKTYPFRISLKNQETFYVAGIYTKSQFVDDETGELINKTTYASLTCPANDTLSKIHNNPKMVARIGHRMLVILNQKQAEKYLEAFPENANEKEEKQFLEELRSLCTAYQDEAMDFHTVRNLRARKDMDFIGNVPEIIEPYRWPELDYNQFEKGLFG